MKRTNKENNINIQVRFSVEKKQNDIQLVGEYFLEIDGVNPYPKGDVFDYRLFNESLMNPGQYFIFNCSCGIPECTGRTEGALIQVFEDQVILEDLDYKKVWSFDKESIMLQIEQLKNEVSFFIGKFKAKGLTYTIKKCY